MIRGEEISGTSELVEELVFIPKDRCRPDDGGLWEYTPYHFFCAALCAEKFRFRVLVRIVRGHMHKSVDIIFGDGFCYTLCAFNMDVLQVKVSAVVRIILGLRGAGLAL